MIRTFLLLAFIWLRAAIWLMAAAPIVLAQASAEKILQSSVAVFGTVEENGKKKPVSRGGGFVLGPRHVVASLSACCDKVSGGRRAVPVVAVEGYVGTARLAWMSEASDLAILELKDPINRPSVTIATLKTADKDQTVYTAQFPDPGESGTTPKITEGKLVSLVKVENTDIKVYKTTAAMNRANAGGGLFDACGNVLGVNMMYKDGAQYAYVADPLIGAARTTGVNVSVTEERCGSAGVSSNPSSGGEKQEGKKPARRGEWRLPEGDEWIPVVLLGAAIVMAFRPARKKAAQSSAPHQPLPEPAPYAGSVAIPAAVPMGRGRPVLRGVAGQYAGKAFALDAGSSTLGRDQRVVNLVFSPEATSISKRHCTVRWDSTRNTFVLEDLGSTNGTYLATGERLAAGFPRDLKPGERFYIGDLRNQFEVRME